PARGSSRRLSDTAESHDVMARLDVDRLVQANSEELDSAQRPPASAGQSGETLMGFLTDQEIAELNPSELLPHPTPIPTQIVSSDEFTPPPQSEKQKEVEALLIDMADTLGKHQGLSRRQFFQSAAGMAAGFV